ncbi:erythromycin esterase family protein [Streptomyces niveus]|uniref:erythromycin esterase family protein n=1 Tax=Streptomyces niveus TaxID=193462 RepID=UPI003665C5BD
MAGSVLWHLERLAPGTRIVLAAHNAHIQTTLISLDGHFTGLPMGQQLRRALGDDYFTLVDTALNLPNPEASRPPSPTPASDSASPISARHARRLPTAPMPRPSPRTSVPDPRTLPPYPFQIH